MLLAKQSHCAMSSTRLVTPARDGKFDAQGDNRARIAFVQESSVSSAHLMVVWPTQRGMAYSRGSFAARLTSLSRRAAQAVERVQALETAWAKFLPQVSLETAIDAVKAGKDIIATEMKSEFTNPPLHPGQGQPTNAPTEHSSVISDASWDDSDHDYEHQRADSLEWDESVDLATLSDGIGSLSLQSQGIGYMGPQSGNALLRNLQSFSGSSLMSEDESIPFWNSDFQLSDDVLRSSSFAGRCVDAYFKYYHCAYPMMHEGHFRAQLMGKISNSYGRPDAH